MDLTDKEYDAVVDLLTNQPIRRALMAYKDLVAEDSGVGAS
jgi:hypothetical protein